MNHRAFAHSLPVLLEPEDNAELASANEWKSKGLAFVEPRGYLDFLGLYRYARLVLPDSVGSGRDYVLGIPVLLCVKIPKGPAQWSWEHIRSCA